MSHSCAVPPLPGPADTQSGSVSSEIAPQLGLPRGRNLTPKLHVNRGCVGLFLAFLACLTVALSGCGYSAKAGATSGSTSGSTGTLQVSPNTVNFGAVSVGQTASTKVSLLNAGASSVQIAQLTVSGQTFSLANPASLPVTIPAGGTQTIEVSFKPGSAGSYTGELVAMNPSAQPLAQVAMSGSGMSAAASADPQLTLSATSLSFGNETVDSPATKTLTLTSTGTSAVTISSATIAGSGYTLSGATFPVTLNPNQTATLAVQFDPTATGTATGQITINSNSSANGAAVVNLSGTGMASAPGAPGAPASNPQLTLSATSLSFGNETVDSPATKTLTLTSTGTSAVTISSATIAGSGFTFSGVTFPVTLNPNQTATLAVQFDPTAPGAATGQITIDSNSSANGAAVVNLSGTGVAAASNPQLTVSPASVSFGDVTVNSTSTQPVTLTSTGSSPVTISSATLNGTGFTISGAAFPLTLNPHQAVTLAVHFAPTTTGAATGQITIDSNSSSGTTAIVNVSGTGAAAPSPQLTVSAASLTFGDVTVNSSSTQSVTLTSTGTAPVTINSATLAGAGFTMSGATFPMTLNPNQAATLAVRFTPTTTGGVTGKITIDSNSSTNGTAVVNLSGVGAAAASPQLTVSAASLTFGDVTVNSSSTQSVTLTSTGTAPVTINSATLAGTGFTMSGATFPMTLNPNQAATLAVRFTPTTTGGVTGQITIDSNSSTNGTAVVNLSGVGAAATSPQLTLSAASLAFGDTTVGSTATQSLTMTSTGTAPVTINSATLKGAGFTVSGRTFPATLNPNQSLTVEVQFDPSAVGSALGELTITSNSSTNSTVVVNLSGNGTAASSPQLTLSAASLSFGNVTVSSTVTQALTLTSTGTAPVTINSATLNGSGFTMSGGTFPVTLSPNQAVTLQVQFDPTTTGAATGQLTISSNSSTNSTAIVNLSGTGTAALTSLLTVSTANLSFGNVTVSSTATQAMTLTSTGTAPVTINSATLNGSGFTVSGGTFPVTLNPNQVVTLQIQFHPTATGAATGQLTISSSSSTNSTAIVNLSGTGTAALTSQLTVSTANLSFGNVTVGSPATLSVTLTSSGTAPVTISAGTLTGTGFTMSGATFPVTLNPGTAVTLQVQFNPTTAGAATGQITITSNSSTNGTGQITLSGTGVSAPHEVDLSWSAPSSSSDPVAGYHIYRATSGSSSYQLLNSSVDTQTTYVDKNVVSGTTYVYVVKSVDSSGNESAASNQATATVP